MAHVIVPAGHAARAAQIPGIQVTAAPDLAAVLHTVSGQQLPDAAALDRIAEILRDPEWAPGMLEDIAGLITHTGRNIENHPGDSQTWARH